MLHSPTMNSTIHRRVRVLRRFHIASLALAIYLAGAVGCDARRGVDPEVDHSEIEALLRTYLPKLGEAYATQDTSVLEGLAVAKEMSRIELRTRELDANGQVYEPIFREITVEDVSVWNYSNAFVTTLEVWDVSSYTVGSHILVNQSLGQRNRVKYQLKRRDDSWVILYRELDQTFEP